MWEYNYTYLAHHGILGQKWGVRRFQNPDGSLTYAGKMRLKGAKRKQDLIKTQLGIDIDQKTLSQKDPNSSKELYLPKGSKVYHVTPKKFEKINNGQELFISASDYDRNLYKSMLTMQMRKKGYGKDIPISEVEFTLSQDLRSPSNKQQKDIFNEVYKHNKKIFDNDINNYYSKEKVNSEDIYDKFIKTLDKSSEAKKIFYEALKNNGYNAVLDQHDVDNSWMCASQPLIIMDASKMLSDLKSTEIDDAEIKKALKNLNYI
jgi:hypothetical protein